MKLMKMLKPELVKEKKSLVYEIKDRIKTKYSYQYTIIAGTTKHKAISKWLYNINPDFIKDYLMDRTINGVAIKMKGGEYAYNPIEITHSFTMKISKYGWIHFSPVEKSKDNDDDCYDRIRIRFFGEDAYINYRKWIIFYKRFNKLNIKTRIKFYTEGGVTTKRKTATTTYVDPRDIDTVYTPNDIHKEICGMYLQWAKNKNFYSKLGVSNKLGILLRGPVGSGKSTIGRLLASQKTKDGYRGILIAPNMTRVKESLLELTSNINEANIKIVLLEDIDTVLNRPIQEMNQEEAENARNLLQILDGINSPKNTVFVATTNFYDKVIKNVPNLIRPGRFDINEEIGYINKETADKMISGINKTVKEFNNFIIEPDFIYLEHSKLYPELSDEYSPAAIQTIIINEMNRRVLLKGKNKSVKESTPDKVLDFPFLVKQQLKHATEDNNQ